MSYDEAIGSIARETGWPIEYILGLPEYWRRIMMGWKPRPKFDKADQVEADRRNRAVMAGIRAQQAKQGKARRG